ncbi:tRNA lysidine(34) synthetase TilS [Emcibacter nanhaiensis]|uniref:tRNA(Ile)-lysidine synthase n=1 Tax=Emcibacter nanhaiensis TaxID=1505037 RepID=A0A501PNG2_9PROT|nr:tRNA lysidine(34) synthetase TilS [Emcibacter nanhaiensis]TPD61979.1 tRNA lysidine(34) synthetase TilS [Emcibacter nanhaiensis]
MDEALTTEQFDLLMRDLPGMDLADETVAVAVSGGADSMALALLLADWCRGRGVKLVALSVNHGLRPEASAECEQVHDWLTARQIAHETLTWSKEIPASSIQEQARKIRYELLGARCVELGVKHLFLAHHQDDQAETFLLRLARGSGVDGLAAMRKTAAFPFKPGPIASEQLPLLCRPLLDCSKQQLVDYLTSCGQAWIEDPSNRDLKHNRVQVRGVLAHTTITGLTAARLAETAGRMQAVQDLLERMTGELEEKAVRLEPLGYALIDVAELLAAEREIALRLLARLLKIISGAEFPPRFEKTCNLYNRLAAGNGVDQTIGGCRAVLLPGGSLLLFREEAAIIERREVSAGEQLLWDGRFQIAVPVAGQVGKLGQEGWFTLVRERPKLKQNAVLKYVGPTLPHLKSAAGKQLLPLLLTGEENSAFEAVFHLPADNFAEMR